MFHAINAWLARQARRARDYRLARGSAIAAANGWQVRRVAGSTYRYRDPRFDMLAAERSGDGKSSMGELARLEVAPDWGDSDALYQWWTR